MMIIKSNVVDWWGLVLISFLSKDGEPEYKSV